MQIDWITVAAQIVNFLVLVWLLQRFLYKPIASAMKRREQRIEDRLNEAKAAREEAEEEASSLRRKQQELEEEKASILEDARSEASRLREDLKSEIREEMEHKRSTWQQHLHEERDEFARQLQRRAGKQVLGIAARVLSEFADSDLSERIADRFIRQVEELDEETVERLVEAASRSDGARLETGQPLGSTIRSKITRALHNVISDDLPVEYREDEHIVLGVRLTIGEQTLEWSVDRYLQRLETTLDEVLETESHQSRPEEPGSVEPANRRNADERSSA